MDVAEVLDQLRTQPVSAGSALDVTCAEAYQYAPGLGTLTMWWSWIWA